MIWTTRCSSASATASSSASIDSSWSDCRATALPHRVPTRIADGPVEPSAGDPLGGALQAADPAGEDPRGEVADDQHEREHDATRDQQPRPCHADRTERVAQRGRDEDDAL